MTSLKEQLALFKIVPVIVVEEAEDIIPLGEALVKNGLPAVEINVKIRWALMLFIC